MQDFPAAHSMDTEWFAVDASGNLGLFDSGEGGAVPESNRKIWQAQIDGLDSFLLEMSKNNEQRLIQLKISGDAVVKDLTLKKLQDGIDEAVQSAGKVIGTQYGPEKGMVKPITLPFLEERSLESWLLLLASDDVISQLRVKEINYSYIVRFTGKPTVIYVRSCRVLILQRLVEEGQILAGKEIEDYGSEFANLFGFFFYQQSSGGPLPYTCLGHPTTPLLLDDLPEHLQDLVSWNWFDRLQFSETQAIQPIEHMPCNTWGMSGWWIDTQGQEHEEHPHDSRS